MRFSGCLLILIVIFGLGALFFVTVRQETTFDQVIVTVEAVTAPANTRGPQEMTDIAVGTATAERQWQEAQATAIVQTATQIAIDLAPTATP